MENAADRPQGLLAPAYDPLAGEHFNRNTEALVREARFQVARWEWLWRDGVVLLVARPA